MKKFLIFFYTLVFGFYFSQQKPAFWDDIQHFKQLDKDNPPPKDAILFVGSSSFTKWTDVNDYFPGKTLSTVVLVAPVCLI